MSRVKRQTITTQCAAGHAKVLLRVSAHVSQFRNRNAKDGSPGIEPLLYLRAWLEAAPPDSHVTRTSHASQEHDAVKTRRGVMLSCALGIFSQCDPQPQSEWQVSHPEQNHHPLEKLCYRYLQLHVEKLWQME